MAENDEAPQDLYVAAYGDSTAAETAWNSLKQLVADDVIEVEALALVNRDSDGKVHVKDTTRETGVGATIGAVGGAIVGLIFPPSMLATAALGAGLGAGAGKVVDRVGKRKIKAEVEWTLPPDGSGVVVVFDEKWVTEVEKALSGAVKISRDHLHDHDEGHTPEPGHPEPYSRWVAPPSNI
jgi:uncharacterized membrane protein